MGWMHLVKFVMVPLKRTSRKKQRRKAQTRMRQEIKGEKKNFYKPHTVLKSHLSSGTHGLARLLLAKRVSLGKYISPFDAFALRFLKRRAMKYLIA